MVATLVVVLPSSYEGGEIVVRHDGQEQTIDFSGVEDSAFQIHFAAFYADCEHEVRPLRKGYRLCLVYNLTLAKSKKSDLRPRNSDHIERIGPLLREWATDDSAREAGHHAGPSVHQGRDRLGCAERRGSRQGASPRGSRASGGLQGLSGAADVLRIGLGGGRRRDGYGYGRRRRWYDEDEDEDDDEDDDGEHEMGEIFETSLTAKHWIDSEGNGLPIGELSVEEDEVLDPESLTDVDPEEEFEGYTGNAGMTLERWYRHAAIILWPERRHFEILCDRDSRNVVPVLTRWWRDGRKSTRRTPTALKANASTSPPRSSRSGPRTRHAGDLIPRSQKPPTC